MPLRASGAAPAAARQRAASIPWWMTARFAWGRPSESPIQRAES
jgi:hypothetical protein